MLGTLVPVRVSGFVVRIVNQDLLIFVLTTVVPAKLSRCVPSAFAKFVLVYVVAMDSAAVMLLAIKLGATRHSLVCGGTVHAVRAAGSWRYIREPCFCMGDQRSLAM